jgi:ABC-type lipoprotein export system ATPase subunit
MTTDRAAQSPLLQFDRVRKTYSNPAGNVTAMRDITVALAPGDFTAIGGPSGCGKSTLLLAAGGLLRPTAGAVTLLNQDLYALSNEARAKLRATAIGFVFQQFHLVPYLTVRDNVLAASLATRLPDAAARADELLARFNLTSRAAHTPGELSTGERQRTAMARALLNSPKLLLADEPTGNLDAGNAAIVLEALSGFARGGGAVLLVTHDDRAAAAATRVMRMKDGALSTDAATPQAAGV